MPIRPSSNLRKKRVAYHGWAEGGKFYLSLSPRGMARNEYESARDALKEAANRHLPIVWEDASKIA